VTGALRLWPWVRKNWSVSDHALTPRQRRILIISCRQYVLTGRPVASAALAHAGLEWSSATIRNELAALERAGLVRKPHSASGRVPSGEGWRIYVESLPRGDARPEHQRLVDVSLGEAIDPRVGLRSTARVLSEISGCVAIGFLGETKPGLVRALELVPLAGGGGGVGGAEDSGRLLVMIGLEDGASSVRTVEVERELLAHEGQLRRLQDLLRELTLGRSLEQARQQLRAMIDAQGQRLDRLVAEALRIGLLLCVASFDPLFMQVAGHGSVLFQDRESDSAAELLALLEDYQRVAEILCQLLPESYADPRASVRVDLALEQLGSATSSGLGVGFGLPLLHAVSEREREGRASGLTLVGCRLSSARHEGGAASRRTGAVALLGSPRMDYEAVIPLVEYAARAMAARG
jgi:heat-inducible transcriptional repressor